MTGKSAEKQTRVASRRQQRNKAIRSQVKTNVTKAEKLVFAGDLEVARASVTEAVSSLDKAAEKKILHPNNAARRKSRLLKKLNEVVVESKALPEAEEE